MLARRLCYNARIVSRAARLTQTQSRLVSTTPRVLQVQDVPKNPNLKDKPLGQSKQGGSGSGFNLTYVVIGAVALGGAYAVYRSTSAKEKLEEGKDKVAGKYVAHKATKEFEKAKELIVNVAKEIGGKDLADKVSKMIDEAKDTLSKMADNYPEAKDKLEKVAGSLSHGDAKDKLSKVLGALGASNFDKYIKEFDNVKEGLLKEAKKLGDSDVAKKLEKAYDDAKDKIQKMAKNIGDMGWDKAATELTNTKDTLMKEIKKIGGDDLAKKAEKLFDEAKDKIQKVAQEIDEGNIISDSQYQMARDFLVKEAEKLGGRDLAKKAGKMMDEAKEKIQKLAHDLKNQ